MIGVCIISLAFLLSSCMKETENQTANSSQKVQTSVSENGKNITIEDIKNPLTLEEEKYYKLLQGEGNNYYYYIYDDNKEVVNEGGFYWRSPKMSMVNDNIVKLSTQTGTGLSTSSTFYYNAKKDVISRTFHSVYDEMDELLVFSDHKKLIVRNIFDKTVYYREFTEFKSGLADVIEPFINAKFINENKQIQVTYLVGKDLTETTDVINLT